MSPPLVDAEMALSSSLLQHAEPETSSSGPCPAAAADVPKKGHPKNQILNSNCKANSWEKITPPESDHVECFPQEALRPDAIVGMLDMDAFEVQIYLKKGMGVVEGRKMYLTTPIILADPSTDRIISVNFLAKEKGISRQDRVGSAKEKCPEIVIIRKAVRFDKPENINLRHSSWEVLDAILKFRQERKMNFVVEYASNDEYYMDLTHQVDFLMADGKFMELLNESQIERTFLENAVQTLESPEIIGTFHQIREGRRSSAGIGPESTTMLRLILGCTILREIQKYVFDQTNFEGSCGMGVNKLLAKLATPLHKPGGITILTQAGLHKISGNIPVTKIPSLGGERGKMLSELIRSEDQIQREEKVVNPEVVGVTVQDLATLPFSKLLTAAQGISLGEMMVLRKLAQGISTDPVVEKLMKMTASVGRANLRGLRFHNYEGIREVIFILVAELMERLTEEEIRHKRIPEFVQVGLSYIAFPRKEEDRGKPPLSECFAYLFNPRAGLTLNASSQELVKAVYRDVLQTVQGSGVIVKISFVIKAFRG